MLAPQTQSTPKMSGTGSAKTTKSVELDLMTFLPHRLAILSRLTQVLLAAALEQCDMTIAQWRVYLCLVQEGPSTLNGISEFTSLPQSSLSRSVAKMAERGLVQNQRDASDRRISKIEITDEGRAQLQKAIRAIKKNWADVFASQPIEEESFLETVNQLIVHLSQHTEK